MLKNSIVRNYFNFELCAIELNNEFKRQGGSVGAVGLRVTFTEENCRQRWSYLHLMRKGGDKTEVYLEQLD